MNKNIIKIASLGAVTAGVLLMSSGVSAYQGDMTKVGPNHTEEREAAIEAAMTNKDFAAWKTLMTEDGRTPGVLRKIDTQEEFNTFAEALTLAKAGKVDEANALRSSLGLGNGSGRNGGQRGNGGSSFVDANKDGVCDNLQ